MIASHVMSIYGGNKMRGRLQMGNGNLTWCELHTLLSTTYYSGGTRRAPGSIICGWNWTRLSVAKGNIGATEEGA